MAAAVALPASCDMIGIERIAQLMSDLLSVAVSTGFVSSCLERLDASLTGSGVEDDPRVAAERAKIT